MHILCYVTCAHQKLMCTCAHCVREFYTLYIVILKSALLEYFNLYVLKNKFSIVFYLRKTFYSEI